MGVLHPARRTVGVGVFGGDMTTKEERVKQGIERAMLAYGYRKEGMKYKDICALMGVSYTRIRQLIEKAERILARDMRT